MVVLKPLARALADGDRVYAVILGTAMNQDGWTPGMTVPNQEAQEALIRSARSDAGVSPSAIQYVEAHGTGTPVGDPIEARALGRVLSDGRPDDRPYLVGSVKTNIGHLEAGAGIAGLIKAVLALPHRRIPGKLHFDRPNAAIDFDALRLRVPTRLEPWPDGDGPALAGVNAFGFGGTNAHVIARAPRATNFGVEAGEPGGRAWLIPLSARSPSAHRTSARSWAKFLESGPADLSLEDVAANAALRRTHHDHRLAVVARSGRELAERLGAFAGSDAATGRAQADRRPRLAFACAGQGPQWWAMGRQLLNEEPAFRDAVERCDAIVGRLGD